jgi:hypothetical protein
MTGVHLNGATIMATPTDRHLRIAREIGYEGVEVRAERLLAAPEEVASSADIVRPSEVWSPKGIQLQLTPERGLDHPRLAAEMAPRLDICRRLAAAYLLVVPPRAAGADRERAIGAMRDGLAILRDTAAPHGISIAFEFLGFAEAAYVTSVAARQKMDAVAANGERLHEAKAKAWQSCAAESDPQPPPFATVWTAYGSRIRPPYDTVIGRNTAGSGPRGRTHDRQGRSRTLTARTVSDGRWRRYLANRNHGRGGRTPDG